MGPFGEWHDAIFLLPGGAGLLLMLLCALGGGRHHHTAGGGHHAAGHLHVHSHGVHAAHPVASPPLRPSAIQQAAAFFGNGRVPAPLTWGSGLLGWGLFGYWATRLLVPMTGSLAWSCLVFGLAALGGLAAVRLTAAVWTRLLPAEETFVTETVDLCGLTGTVVYPVDEAHGRAHVYDAYGTLHDVSARVAAGQAAIGRDQTILVTDYDAARDVVIVEDLP